MVLALLALFVALSGTAVAAGVVPLAKRALVADNAKTLQGKTAAALLAHEQFPAKKALVADNALKLGGMTGAAIAALPSPASSAAGLLTIKNQAGLQVPDDNYVHQFTIACDEGQKIVTAGFSADKVVIAAESYPLSDTTWSMDLAHYSTNPAPAIVTLYALCTK
ncbi:MAG: hypothetical protein ACM3QU_08550 [Verrucomicrobiota bacterium]